MECPACGLLNPESAKQCDCGHRLGQSGLRDALALRARLSRAKWGMLVSSLITLGSLAATFGSLMGALLDEGGGTVFLLYGGIAVGLAGFAKSTADYIRARRYIKTQGTRRLRPKPLPFD